LGTKYSQAMNARITDESGREQVMVMGCYGIGISRAVAAAIEQHHDARGIVWPPAMAPFAVAIVPVNAHQSDRVRDTSERLYDELAAAGHEVLLMDRPRARLGAMLADVELIGIPTVLVVGERGLAEGNVECRNRSDGTQTELKIDTVAAWLATQS
jgi:prolyl-tRNA synthetase